MPRPRRSIAWSIAVLGLALLLGRLGLDQEATHLSEVGSVEELFRAQHSDVVVEGVGTVAKILTDDLKGSKHQRFILRLGSGHSLLVSHNIDLAPRVSALSRGDEIGFRGVYVWNERGGLVHWTHHDPDGRRSGGWLRHGGHEYR